MPGGEYEYVDLGEKRVIPGLIDCHMHPVIFSRLRQEDFLSASGSHFYRRIGGSHQRTAKIKKKASGFRAGDMTKKNSKNTEPLIDGTWIKEQKISLWNCFDPALT